MHLLLTILLLLAMGATLVMLIRGIAAFVRSAGAGGPDAAGGPSQASLKQNRAMVGRILFQALAVIVVALLLMMRHSS